MSGATNRTPGDWTLEYDGSLVMAGQIVTTGPVGPDYASAAEKKANTRLMSAAPDLFDAWADYIAADEARDHERAALAIEAGRAALAKARGG